MGGDLDATGSRLSLFEQVLRLVIYFTFCDQGWSPNKQCSGRQRDTGVLKSSQYCLM